jgi:hypothetical protein
VRSSGPSAGLVAASVLALVLGLAGCGGGSDGTDGPSAKAVSCRKEWTALQVIVDDRNTRTNPSALAARWNSIAATLDYYGAAATAKDCGSALSDQRKAMDALSAFGSRLAAYDMELRLERVQADAEAYAGGQRTPSPAPSPSAAPKKGTKAKKPPAPPKPAAVAVALKTLAQQAPVATQQQGPGWQQADVTELSDAAAVTKAVADLAFLSSESQAYRACTAALTVINAALSAS